MYSFIFNLFFKFYESYNFFLNFIFMRGEFGGEWIHVYVWVNPFIVHLKL